MHYGYETNLGVGHFPASIQIAELMDGREVEREEFLIFSLGLSNPEAKESFDPRPFISSNNLALLYFTNSAFYSLDQRGKLRRPAWDDRAGIPGVGPTGAFWPLAITLGFAFLLIGRHHAKQQNPQNYRENKI